MTDKALVNGVKSTLAICTDIVEAVGDFLSIFEEDRRRADSQLGKKVTEKLTVCRNLVELVDNFRLKHFSPLKRGAISLRLKEGEFLDKLLKSASKKRGETIYVASKDGDSASEFHKRCDDQGPTVILVESTNGAVFGGYTDQSWKGNDLYRKSSKSFLFRLRPTTLKYSLISSATYRYAIRAISKSGPRFGNGPDLMIANNALKTKNSFTKGGYAYKFPGTKPNYQLNDGIKYFQVKDYVVMKAIKM